jgi:hypothetical protein
VVGVVMNRIPKNREYYYGGYKYYSAYGSGKHYYASAEPKAVVEANTRPSLLQSLPRAVTEEQKPAPAGSFAPLGNLPIHKPIQLNLDRPGNNGNGNGKPVPEEIEDADDHPSVDKLFANMTDLPPQTPSQYRKNGHS